MPSYVNRSAVSPEERVTMLGLYQQGHSTIVIGRQLGRSGVCVAKHVKRAGGIIRNASRRVARNEVKEDYFSSIDTPTKAYLLGLTYSDGNVYKNRYALRLQERDRQVLELAKIEIGYTGTLYKQRRRKKNRQDLICLCVCRKEFVAHLLDKGVIPNKTSKLTFPTCVPEPLIVHFVHGLFDGDGCITLNRRVAKTGNTELRCTVDIAGTRAVLEGVQRYFITLGIEGKLYPCPTNVLSARLKYRGLRSIRAVNHLYRNRQHVFIRRKYLKYQSIVESFADPHRYQCLSTRQTLDDAFSILRSSP